MSLKKILATAAATVMLGLSTPVIAQAQQTHEIRRPRQEQQQPKEECDTGCIGIARVKTYEQCVINGVKAEGPVDVNNDGILSENELFAESTGIIPRDGVYTALIEGERNLLRTGSAVMRLENGKQAVFLYQKGHKILLELGDGENVINSDSVITKNNKKYAVLPLEDLIAGKKGEVEGIKLSDDGVLYAVNVGVEKSCITENNDRCGASVNARLLIYVSNDQLIITNIKPPEQILSYTTPERDLSLEKFVSEHEDKHKPREIIRPDDIKNTGLRISVGLGFDNYSDVIRQRPGPESPWNAYAVTEANALGPAFGASYSNKGLEAQLHAFRGDGGLTQGAPFSDNTITEGYQVFNVSGLFMINLIKGVYAGALADRKQQQVAESTTTQQELLARVEIGNNPKGVIHAGAYDNIFSGNNINNESKGRVIGAGVKYEQGPFSAEATVNYITFRGASEGKKKEIKVIVNNNKGPFIFGAGIEYNKSTSTQHIGSEVNSNQLSLRFTLGKRF